MNIDTLIKENEKFEVIMSGISSEIKNRFVIRKVNANTIIANKDDKVTSVYLLYSGSMRIINEFDNGYNYSYADIGFMDIVGDIEVLSGKFKFAATVKSVTECIMINISVKDFMYVFEKNHAFSKEIAKMLARKMYPSSYGQGNFVYHSVEYNLTLLIIELVEKDVMANGCGKVVLKRTDISERLATTVRSVNRSLKKLRESESISIVKGKITVNTEQYNILVSSLINLK